MNLGKRRVRMKSHYLAVLIIIALFSIASYLTGKYACIVQEHLAAQKTSNEAQTSGVNDDMSRVLRGCNLFSGRWIFDNASYPLYKEEQCSVMLNFLNDFRCEIYGRKDKRYQKWRWQPHGCDLPMFDATELLHRIRGKRVVFVGDSLGRNQWTSLICMIQSSLQSSLHRSSSPVRHGNLFVFEATEYNARIEFYWSPYLVESNCDDPYHHSNVPEHTVRINAIEKHARHWNDADILVFDSFMWWRNPSQPFSTLLWGSFGSPDAIYKRVEMNLRPYEMGLTTLSDWLEININPNKTKLFFTSQTPYHKRGINCYNETEPMLEEVYGYAGMTTERGRMRIVESFIRKLETRGLKVVFLNITNLSDRRKDGHPSIYKMKYHPDENKGRDPRWYSDCVHWCLPGVPDIWNQILYTYIINS